jgi:transposase
MISNDLRKRIIDSYINGYSKKEISEIFNIKISTIYAIIDVYLKEGRINASKKGGQRRKSLDLTHEMSLREWIDEDASITLNSLKTKLFEKHGITVSIKTVDNYIDGFNYSFKRISLIPSRRNEEDVLNLRFIYAQKFLKILSMFDKSNLYFVDEVGFNISLRSRSGRSLRGTRAIHVVPGLRSRNISVCCAISKFGILYYKAQSTL